MVKGLSVYLVFSAAVLLCTVDAYISRTNKQPNKYIFIKKAWGLKSVTPITAYMDIILHSHDTVEIMHRKDSVQIRTSTSDVDNSAKSITTIILETLNNLKDQVCRPSNSFSFRMSSRPLLNLAIFLVKLLTTEGKSKTKTVNKLA